ncbi:MAG: hypothetical protein JJ896_11530 [Rhodothermales bacterium]|nr:hypothetical protein [Rhodothermales bacterium]MBO6780274.1 hypothetical protein [Rhodothermales bacterium]
MRLLPLCLLLALPVSAQQVGPSFEAYPAGVIVTARYSLDTADSSRVHIHAGMNATSRRDWGEHDDERGAGFGLGVAGHRYLQGRRSGPWVGLRMDVWQLTIDWIDDGRVGESKVTVAQPTARAGWTLSLGKADLDFSLGLGAEINVRTQGEAVGQGAILLGGIALGY